MFFNCTTFSFQASAILRKKHKIHVSGQSIPTPLESFQDLETRYRNPPSSVLLFNTPDNLISLVFALLSPQFPQFLGSIVPHIFSQI